MTIEELLELPRPLSAEHQSMLHAHTMEAMAKLGGFLLMLRMQVRTKPLIGGAFGSGRYLLASRNEIHTGLDRVRYMVLEEKTWMVLCCADTIQEALSGARDVLAKFDPLSYAAFVGRLVIRRDEEAKEQAEQRKAEREANLEAMRASRPEPVKSIPKRRKQIFEASDGKCHYCGSALALDGRWHIEHKMPKALMGGNEPSNLVASCVSCNHKKRDKTDLEFIAERAKA